MNFPIREQIIHSNESRLFNAEDPMERDILFPEEEKNLKDEINKCEAQIKELKKQKMLAITTLYPQIKESDLIEEIEFQDIKYLMYELVPKCPRLLQNENNIKTILSYIMQKDPGWAFYNPSARRERMRTVRRLSSSTLMDENLSDYLSSKNLNHFEQVLRSDILAGDKKTKKLMEYIKNKSTNYNFHIETKENILKKFPHISREFLFYPKKYLLEHIEDSKTLRYLNLMRKMYANKSLSLEYGSMLKNIFDTYNCEDNNVDEDDLNEIFIKCDNEFDKLKIAVLLNIRDADIIQHMIDILHNFDFEKPYYKVTSILIIALLKATNTTNQDILINFLDKEEIANTILNKNSFYYHFLIEKINQKDYGTITSIFDFQEDDANIIEKLKHYFEQFETKYIYFTMYDKKVYKTPVNFYEQFIKNALSEKENYLAQCLNENQQENFFYNGRIIFDIIDKEYIRLAEDILEFGINRPLDYDINNEIYWNLLCTNTQKEIENEELELSSDELIRMLLKGETKETTSLTS